MPAALVVLLAGRTHGLLFPNEVRVNLWGYSVAILRVALTEIRGHQPGQPPPAGAFVVLRVTLYCPDRRSETDLGPSHPAGGGRHPFRWRSGRTPPCRRGGRTDSTPPAVARHRPFPDVAGQQRNLAQDVGRPPAVMTLPNTRGADGRSVSVVPARMVDIVDGTGAVAHG